MSQSSLSKNKHEEHFVGKNSATKKVTRTNQMTHAIKFSSVIKVRENIECSKLKTICRKKKSKNVYASQCLQIETVSCFILYRPFANKIRHKQDSYWSLFMRRSISVLMVSEKKIFFFQFFWLKRNMVVTMFSGHVPSCHTVENIIFYRVGLPLRSTKDNYINLGLA